MQSTIKNNNISVETYYSINKQTNNQTKAKTKQKITTTPSLSKIDK